MKTVPSIQSAETFGATVGVFPRLEVGVLGIDNNKPGGSTQALLNAKFKVLGEGLVRPSVTIGVVDAADRMKHIGLTQGIVTDPSVFIVLGKNLTAAAEKISDRVVEPLRLNVGIGSGIYKGAFAGLNYYLTPRISLMGEYLSNGIRQQGTGNAGVRWNPTGGWSIEAGTLGFSNLYGGVNYTVKSY